MLVLLLNPRRYIVTHLRNVCTCMCKAENDMCRRNVRIRKRSRVVYYVYITGRRCVFLMLQAIVFGCGVRCIRLCPSFGGLLYAIYVLLLLFGFYIQHNR